MSASYQVDDVQQARITKGVGGWGMMFSEDKRRDWSFDVGSANGRRRQGGTRSPVQNSGWTPQKSRFLKIFFKSQQFSRLFNISKIK